MQLLVASQKAEAEVVNGKTVTVTIKAKAATTNDELVNLKQQVSDLVAVHSTPPITKKNMLRFSFIISVFLLRATSL